MRGKSGGNLVNREDSGQAAGAGWAAAGAGAAVAGGDFFAAADFLRLRYFFRRCRFSALLYCLLIVLYFFPRNSFAWHYEVLQFAEIGRAHV